MIVPADPEVDPKIERRADPSVDIGIIGWPSPCVHPDPRQWGQAR
jgi:hypothetical protein